MFNKNLEFIYLFIFNKMERDNKMRKHKNSNKLNKLNRIRRHSNRIKTEKLLFFINSSILVSEILRKNDLIKLKIDESFMIHNTIDPSLNNKIGIVVSEPIEGDIGIDITINNELIKDVPKFFCCLEENVFLSRISNK